MIRAALERLYDLVRIDDDTEDISSVEIIRGKLLSLATTIYTVDFVLLIGILHMNGVV